MKKTMMNTTPALIYSIIISMFASFIIFTGYLYPVNAYSQARLSSLSPLYKSIVSSNSSSNEQQQQIQQRSQSKVIEASGHFANNQLENDSVSWIQGGLWHLAVYNSSFITIVIFEQ